MTDHFELKKPPVVTAETLPDGRRFVTVDARDMQAIPDRPQWLVCDFCCQKADRLWCYPTFAFSSSRITCDETAEWSACVHCYPLFDGGDFESLVARVVTLNPEIGLTTKQLGNLYWTARAACRGPVILWESGQAYDGGTKVK